MQLNEIFSVTLIKDKESEDWFLSEKTAEWEDGTPAEGFKPSEDGVTFNQFPYWILMNPEGEVSWRNYDELLLTDILYGEKHEINK
jgi:hypothetical protein